MITFSLDLVAKTRCSVHIRNVFRYFGNMNTYDLDLNANMEPASALLNNPLNLQAIAIDEIISNDCGVVAIPIYVAEACLGNIQNDGIQESNASRLLNTGTNLSEIQLINESEMYIPALCLVPLSLLNADCSFLPAQDASHFSTPLPTETLEFSALSPDLNQSDTGISTIDPTTSISCTDSSLNQLYNQESETSMQKLLCVSTDADISSSQIPLFESSLATPFCLANGKDIASSSDDENFSSPSFDGLTTFSISSAPLDCVWSNNDAVTNDSSLPSTGNTSSSFGGTSSGEECTSFNETPPNTQAVFSSLFQSQTPENYSEEIILHDSAEKYPYLNDLLTRLIRATNVEEFDLHTSSTNTQAHSTGAVPNNVSSNSNYSHLAETGFAAVKPLWCKFCYKNKEPAYIYRSHQLKTANGIVTCPILRNYICPICGVSGNFAHTIRYCRVNPRSVYTEHNAQLYNRANTSFIRPPSSPYLNNTALPSISSNITGTFANVQEHLYNEEMQMQTASSSSESNSPTMPYYRFNCAFPSANIIRRKKRTCKFCLRNKQPDFIYRSHELRDETGRISCPYLRQFICGICGATGDNAHTRKYCPANTYEEFIQHLNDSKFN